MTPKLFHLRDTHADARTGRTLLLLAKVGRGGSGENVALGGVTAAVPRRSGAPAQPDQELAD